MYAGKSELCQEIWRTFEKNMRLAEKFVLIAKAREWRMLIRQYRPLATLRDQFGPLRKFLAEAYRVGLPQVLVFAVTCYEACLKGIYEVLKGEVVKEAFLDPIKVKERYRKVLNEDPLAGADRLVVDTRAVILKRNVIVHRAGVIDEKAEEDFKKLGLPQYRAGQEIELNAEEVKRDLNVLRDYVTKVCRRLSIA